MGAVKRFFTRIKDWLLGNRDPREIALGLALGAAISVTPLVGFHAVLAVLLSSITPANRLAALAATQVGNPLTLPFWFWLEIEIGGWISGTIVETELDFTNIDTIFKSLGGFLGEAALPWMIGAGLLSLAVGLVVYYLTILVAKLLHLRMRRRLLVDAAGLDCDENADES